MQFAARKFVVVSPLCKWNWRELPHAWIGELVCAFQTLRWIDHQRTYLTGCSMGGMGAWYVGARNPDLFASISLVAAHHRTPDDEYLFERLKDVPIHVVHSPDDETCPLHLEEQLWIKWRQTQFANFSHTLFENVGHILAADYAYGNSTGLYDWHLRYRRRDLPVTKMRDGFC